MKQRTIQQNKSLHIYFQWLATALNDAGYDVKKTLKEDFELDWSEHLVKEILFKSLIKAKFGKYHTADLTSGELQIAYEEMNRHIANKFGLFVPFPSLDLQIEQTGKVDYPTEEVLEPKF